MTRKLLWASVIHAGWTRIAAAILVAGVMVVPANSASADTQSCTPAEQTDAFRADQAAVLARVGSLATLNNYADVAALSVRGWPILSHAWNSFQGMGVAIVQPTILVGVPPQPGNPQLLFYAPADGSVYQGPMVAQFPYHLVGWAYTGVYNYSQTPTTLGPCFSREIWFVHERGYHPFDNFGFVAAPPAEQFHGQDGGQEPLFPSAPGAPHSRMWDVHMFLNTKTGVPQPGIVRSDGPTIPGIVWKPGVDFFYPAGPQATGPGTGTNTGGTGTPSGSTLNSTVTLLGSLL